MNGLRPGKFSRLNRAYYRNTADRETAASRSARDWQDGRFHGCSSKSQTQALTAKDLKARLLEAIAAWETYGGPQKLNDTHAAGAKSLYSW